jgi:hypothetical protein
MISSLISICLSIEYVPCSTKEATVHHRLRSFALRNAVLPSLLVTTAIRPAAIANVTKTNT